MRYNFGDSENIPRLVPDGDYILEVISYSLGLSKKGGHDQIELKCKIQPMGTTVFEKLTFSPEAIYRVDTFLKSCGVPVLKGQSVTFDPSGVRDGEVLVELAGLRGWATLSQREYQGKTNMNVVCWLTNKEKLPRHVPDLLPAGAVEDDVPF